MSLWKRRDGEGFHRRLKDALQALCAAANWVTTFHGSYLASAQQPEKTTAPPPLRQCSAHHSFYQDNFWISLNYLQKTFLSNFLRHWVLSNTLPLVTTPLRHASCRRSCQTNWPAHRQCSSGGTATYRPYPSFAAPCTTSRCALATRKTRCPLSSWNPALILPCPCAAQDQGPPACHRPLPGFSPTVCRRGPQRTFCSAEDKGTAPVTVFPWPADRGFCSCHSS